MTRALVYLALAYFAAAFVCASLEMVAKMRALRKRGRP